MINIPFLILIIISLFNLVLNIVNHGKPKPDYNAYASLVSIILDIALFAWGISWGGFI